MDKDEERAAFKRQLNEAAAAVNDAINPFIGIHTIYTQMVDAGFTKQEACVIIGTCIGYQNSSGSGA